MTFSLQFPHSISSIFCFYSLWYSEAVKIPTDFFFGRGSGGTTISTNPPPVLKLVSLLWRVLALTYFKLPIISTPMLFSSFVISSLSKDRGMFLTYECVDSTPTFQEIRKGFLSFKDICKPSRLIPFESSIA